MEVSKARLRALWGTRACQRWIIITTKKARDSKKKGKVTISFQIDHFF